MFLTQFKHLFMYLGDGSEPAMPAVWKSEDNSHDSVLSFHFAGLGDQTQAIRLGSQCCCRPNLLNGSMSTNLTTPPKAFTMMQGSPVSTSLLLSVLPLFSSLETGRFPYTHITLVIWGG